MANQDTLLYPRFERFWHWSQAILLITMMFTGFDMHGTYRLLDFHVALNIHLGAALALLILWAFAIFWHFTTGEWRQYLPTPSMLPQTLHYYLIGIFRGDPHPHRRTRQSKLNPLQAMAYLNFKLVLAPLAWISGLLLLGRAVWPAQLGWLVDDWWLTLVHVGVAFALLAFLIVHVYMTTTGSTPTHHIRAMITGHDEELEQR